METRTYTVYKFKELPEVAQEKAIEKYYDINVDHEWWDFTCDDAKNIGLEIKEFELDRGSYVKGEFILDETQVAANICKEHGETCETYKTAKRFQADYAKLPEGDDDDTQEKRETLQADFLQLLCEDYRIILQRDYEYLMSKEAIIETFESNDYDFTDDGKIA